MSISTILGDIAQGLGSIVPKFFAAIFDAFINLFCIVTETGSGESLVRTVSGLNALGSVALAFIVLAICYWILPTVVGFLRMRVSSKKKRRATAK